MRRRDLVQREGDADRVVGPLPAPALDRGAERETLVDVGEGHDLILAVIPAIAAEHADIVGDLLLEVEVVADLDAALARLGDGVVGGDAERIGERHGVVVRTREHAVEERTGLVDAGPVVGLEAHLQLGDVAAAREQVPVHEVAVGDGRHQEVAGPHRPVGIVQLGADAIGQADLVRRVVEGAGRPDRPVHEIDAPVLGIVVGVE